MVCPRCARTNEEDARFCARCGLEFAQYQPSASSGEAEFCYRHPKATTVLRCGKCDRPICTRCAKFGPAGQRCPECARQNIKFSFRGFTHDIWASVSGLFRGAGTYRLWILFLILSTVLGFLRGCAYQAKPSTAPIEAPRGTKGAQKQAESSTQDSDDGY